MNNKELTTNEWQSYLVSARDDVINAYLELGKRLYEYKQSCKSVSGGSEFSSNVLEWLNLPQNKSAMLLNIGKDYGKLILRKDNLPKSLNGLYQVTLMDESQRSKVTVNTTAREAKAIRTKPKKKEDLYVKGKANPIVTTMTVSRAEKILGLSPYTEEIVKMAFSMKAKTMHPDKGGNPDDFHNLVEAKNELLDYVRNYK